MLKLYKKYKSLPTMFNGAKMIAEMKIISEQWV